VMIGLTTFLPVFVQGVMQKSPLIGGFALSAMVLGWPVGATVGVRGFRRFGVRAVLRVGGALVPAGAPVSVLIDLGLAENVVEALIASSTDRARLVRRFVASAARETPTVTLGMDRRTFARLAGGRWSGEQARGEGVVRGGGQAGGNGASRKRCA